MLLIRAAVMTAPHALTDVEALKVTKAIIDPKL
jgi:hypothetical protein